MGDLINSIFKNPVDAITEAVVREEEEERIAEQLRPATDNELAEIETIAEAAAKLQDELKAEPVDERPKQLKALKAELLARLLKHGMKELNIPGRPAIEVVVTNNRKPTRKAIIATMEKADPKEGRKKAIQLWNSIEPTTSEKVVIPEPSPPEVESPY
jgi:hypothetical protein